jgi:hypothetical protein
VCPAGLVGRKRLEGPAGRLFARQETGMEELAVIQKTYDLVKWSCGRLGKFPRTYRFTLAERIERRLYDLLETLIQARYTRQRGELLRQANLTLEVLRYQVRLAHDVQCLRTNGYEHASRELHGIGGMVGGWLKTLPVR